MTRMTAVLALLTLLTACDRLNRADQRDEREDRRYRTAMEDYTAGRLDAAISGFKETIRNDPANASARFQLGCLLQDLKRDYQGAYDCYREYLTQAPDSDKARMTRERLAVCERELAAALAAKFGLSGGADLSSEIAAAQKRLAETVKRADAAEQELAETQTRLKAVSAERDRLLAVVKGLGEGEPGQASVAVAKEARELLDETEEGEGSFLSAKEVAALKAEGDEDEAEGPSLLATLNSRPAPPKEKAEPKPAKPALPPRPKTYVVVEGDTLYALSKRFYGTVSAWKRIREANKAVIPADNRLRAGETIVLP